MFKIFYKWLFDGNDKSEIPEDILSYRSPITHTYVISLFGRVGALNYFLNSFNNLGIYCLDKRDLFKFIKECVRDFKVTNRMIQYAYFRKKSPLYNAFRSKYPFLKSIEIFKLCKIVDTLEQRDRIYSSLGLTKPKITKIKTKKEIPNKPSLKGFLDQNFRLEKA